MLKHPDIWRAIDELAARYGFSPSGLAREAGLDATTFNASKRSAADGKKRWPSTESIAKILDVTGASFMEFAALVARTSFKNKIQVLSLTAAAKSGNFDADGKLAGKAWTKHTINAGVDDENAFGIRVTGKALEPFFRADSLLIACPGAKVQKGDRAAVVTADGVLTLREITRINGKTYDMTTLVATGRAGKTTLTAGELRVLAKIAMVVE
ncbi:MAG: S24 family peptidase [Bdellovibrionales bacterium]